MLIKRQLNINWFISLLAISLMCLLIANSVLGSIYISDLKIRMTEITDNYFSAEYKLHSALMSLMQTRINTLNYINTFAQSSTNPEDINKLKAQIRSEFQKNEVNLSSAVLSLAKQENHHTRQTQLSELTALVTNYLLNMEKVFNSQNPLESPELKKIIDNSLATHIKIKGQLESLADLFRQKAYNAKASDDLIIQYFPPILIGSFFAALILGGTFIYVSRREVKKSIVDHTTQALNEAFHYEQDCIQTLEICKNLMQSGLNELIKTQYTLTTEASQQALAEKIKTLTHTLEKLLVVVEDKKIAHNNDSTHIEDFLKNYHQLKK